MKGRNAYLLGEIARLNYEVNKATQESATRAGIIRDLTDQNVEMRALIEQQRSTIERLERDLRHERMTRGARW